MCMCIFCGPFGTRVGVACLVTVQLRLRALVYDILLPTTAMINYAIGLEKSVS